MQDLPEFVRKLVLDKNFGFIATLNLDGSPQVTPVWVDTDGKYILVNTVLGRIKQKNAVRDSRVALSIIDGRDPYTRASMTGRVVEQIKGIVAENHIDKLSKKYRGVDRYARRSSDERRVILKIEPIRIFQ